MDEFSVLPGGFPFSQSSLQDYLDCPRRFKLHYVDHIAWPAQQNANPTDYYKLEKDGQLFHRLVQQYFLGLPTEMIIGTTKSENIHRWWNNFINYPFAFEDWAKYPEITIKSSLVKHQLLAKYDLLTTHEDAVVIYDWKTYRKRPANEKMAGRMQTRVYLSLLILAGSSFNQNIPYLASNIEIIYWFAEHPDEPARFTYSQPQFDQDLAELNALINEIDTHRTYPLTNDEKKCKYCLYRSYCNRGISASEDINLLVDPLENDVQLDNFGDSI